MPITYRVGIRSAKDFTKRSLEPRMDNPTELLQLYCPGSIKEEGNVGVKLSNPSNFRTLAKHEHN